MKEGEKNEQEKKKGDHVHRVFLSLFPRMRWKKDNDTNQGKKICSI